MTKISIFLPVLVMAFANFSSDVLAQPARIAKITEFRSGLVRSIKQRDRKALEGMFAEDFSHTHASGQIDDKTKRVAALLSGDLTIESAETLEIQIRFYGAATAVANGLSIITSNGEVVRYRWTTVYFKPGKRWQIVASQATRVTDK